MEDKKQQGGINGSLSKLLPTDFYWEQGRMVMTESYHKRRGSCCANGCLHCPYEPKHKKGNVVLNIK